MTLMKKFIGIVCAIAVAIGFSSCKETGNMKVTASGSIYEMLVVMNTPEWEGAVGDSVRHYLEADMPCMPQMESYFSLMQSPWSVYDDALKSTRNILLVDINPNRYTQPKLHFKNNVYAIPQAMVTLTAPTAEEMADFIGQNGQALQDWFLHSELQRQADFYGKFCNHDADALLQKKFEVSMKIPADYQLIKEGDDYLWFCNYDGPKRRDIVVYTYPYTDPNTFTKEFLCEKRDSVMRHIGISGAVEDTYMGTEYRHFPPQFRAITTNNAYCAELRGLWRLYGGEAMGGPFVQHTRVDEIHQRVVTAEAFIFAAGQKKRSVYRQAEAILYTLRLPQDANALREVNVAADKANN